MPLAPSAVSCMYLFSEWINDLRSAEEDLEVTIRFKSGGPLRQTFFFPGSLPFPFPHNHFLLICVHFCSVCPPQTSSGKYDSKQVGCPPACGQHLGKSFCRFVPASLVTIVGLGSELAENPKMGSFHFCILEAWAQTEVTCPRAQRVSGVTR